METGERFVKSTIWDRTRIGLSEVVIANVEGNNMRKHFDDFQSHDAAGIFVFGLIHRPMSSPAAEECNNSDVARHQTLVSRSGSYRR